MRSRSGGWSEARGSWCGPAAPALEARGRPGAQSCAWSPSSSFPSPLTVAGSASHCPPDRGHDDRANTLDGRTEGLEELGQFDETHDASEGRGDAGPELCVSSWASRPWGCPAISALSRPSICANVVGDTPISRATARPPSRSTRARTASASRSGGVTSFRCAAIDHQRGPAGDWPVRTFCAAICPRLRARRSGRRAAALPQTRID